MKVLILYPNTPTAGTLGVKLLEMGHSVSVFCPEKVDLEIGGDIIDELEIVGAETDQLRRVENSFSVPKDIKFSDFRIIGKTTQILIIVKLSTSLLCSDPMSRCSA